MILFDSLPDNMIIPCRDSRAQHIVNILKLKEGDTFKMGIINKSEGTGKVCSFSDSGIKISYQEHSGVSLYPVTLMVAQVRPICMKRILREAVSFGVERIILCGSDTGEKSYLSSNLYTTGEYKEYLLDGAMQSCHAGMPDVLFADNVQSAVKIAGSSEDTSYIVLDNVTGAGQLACSVLKDKVVLAIGPERGFSDRERKIFADSGYSPKLIGTRVLRTETACAAGLAILVCK